MRKFGNPSKVVFFIFAIITPYIFNVSVQAADPPQPRPLSPKAQAIMEKRQLFQQEAAAAAPEVEAECAKFIAYVNFGQAPDEPNLNAGLKNIARNRKFAPVFNEQQKAVYYTLASWVYYFDQKPDKAMKQAVLGKKSAPINSNVTKTNLGLSLIYKDYSLATAALIGRGETTESDSQSEDFQSYQQFPSDQLDIDINSIRADLLGKVFDIRPPSAMTDKPVKDVLCLLLWKIDANDLDYFAPKETPKPAETNEPNTPPEIIVEQQPYQARPTPALEAFSQLQSRFKNTKAVFFGINLNDISKTKNFENWLAKNPQPWPIAAPLAQLQEKVTSFLAASPDKPMLVVVGPDSTIRYVGDVNNFLPRMIIGNILNNPQEFAEPNEPNKPGEPNEPNQPQSQADAPVAPVQILTPPAAEPNEPKQTAAVKDANQNSRTVQTPQQPVVNKNAPDEEFTENDYQAIQLLENARTFFKIGNRLQHHTYAKPIEMCRTVIKNYPNTKYAEQARILMRNVPERFRDRFGITNEELGL
ncbi:MAG: hypothetical protein WC496_00730 [Phycisphaerae bacterium]|jgi:hypothetical protein